jgi:hypothetical protein
MAMGILGQIQNATSTQDIVYTVPVGKVAVFNIFATKNGTGTYATVGINNTPIGVENANIEFKGIIGNAGTTVSFLNCTDIVEIHSF